MSGLAGCWKMRCGKQESRGDGSVAPTWDREAAPCRGVRWVMQGAGTFFLFCWESSWISQLSEIVPCWAVQALCRCPCPSWAFSIHSPIPGRAAASWGCPGGQRGHSGWANSRASLSSEKEKRGSVSRIKNIKLIQIKYTDMSGCWVCTGSDGDLSISTESAFCQSPAAWQMKIIIRKFSANCDLIWEIMRTDIRHCLGHSWGRNCLVTLLFLFFFPYKQ